eukprot:TRINITY_DN2507_c0_g2_i1.p2 TRINITY_DN2507_c0_g2~~TRINITY_DN2507_c0_g2_i1.p2  ORF type:complete len:186 (+),score=66.18 TRINITY_DN2507_c0_g2_i1:100-657(+)
MQKLACCMIMAAAPLSALRRATTQEEDFAAAVLARADTNSDGKGSYAELASVVSKIGDVDQNAATSFLEQTFRDVDADADGLLNVNEVANLVSAFRDQLAEGSTDEPEADPDDTLDSVAEEVEDEIAEGQEPGEIIEDLAKSLHVEPEVQEVEELLEKEAESLGAKPEEVEMATERVIEAAEQAD